jgi:hypothetical protein
MATDAASETQISSTRFQYRRRTTCDCPIHEDGEPFTAPLGYRFASDVAVQEIDRATAAAVYEAHHSYMQELPTVNLRHHGIYYQDRLVGAITYRYPLISKKRIRYGTDQQLCPEPVDIEAELPPDLQSTARRILPDWEVVEDEVVAGDTIVEAARICIGVDMLNLASAALAHSQERFVENCGRSGVRFLLTWVRADFDGAMIRALRDKGWTCTGFTAPSQASNREDKPIRERWKWRFLCPVATIREQASLERWSQ